MFTPKFRVVDDAAKVSITCLGTEYGRKFIADSALGGNPILVSGGVGEDVSFDVEFVTNYHAKAILFDPTPRAIQHIYEVCSRFGSSADTIFSNNGKQEASSYNLHKINSENFIFYPFALLNEQKTVNFYAPPVREHVSYSIQNIQNRFTKKGEFIEVYAIGPNEVRQFAGEQINVLKLDIEGSEYEFLKSMFDNTILPDQILVEIDELHFPSIRSYKIAKKLFDLLMQNNYILIYRDGYNFTFLRKLLFGS